MDFTSIFFLILSFVVVLYLLYIFKTKKRTSLLLEVFYISIYFFVGIVFLFPQTLSLIENILGVHSAINFIVYFSIFVSYLLILMLYNKIEDQRVEITRLTREIAYLKEEKLKKDK